jgi:putative transposase
MRIALFGMSSRREAPTMARKPRLHVPGGVYHVILRGNARQDIFFSEADRRAFYGLLEEGTTRFGYRVHAFCLMTNHVHLALQVGDAPLAPALQNLSFRYARHVNWRRDRVGHLFQGRYRALLVDADAYLLELVRYIHLNPVRAHMLDDPAHYAHSSHGHYLGKSEFAFVTTDWVLSQFGQSTRVARNRYARFVMEGLGEGHREDFHIGGVDRRVIGSDSFVERAMATVERKPAHPPSLELIASYVCGRMGMKEQFLTAAMRGRREAHARALIGWLEQQTGAASLTVVGRRFNRDVSTLSRAVSTLDREAQVGGIRARELARHRSAIMQA